MVLQTFVLFSLAFSNRCLYNTNMTTAIVNENYTTQTGRNYRFLQTRQNMMLHVLQAVPVAGERKESSAMQKHAASVIVLLQTEDVSPFSRS